MKDLIIVSEIKKWGIQLFIMAQLTDIGLYHIYATKFGFIETNLEWIASRRG